METKAEEGAPRIEVKEEVASEANGAAESPAAAPAAAPAARGARAAAMGQIDDLVATVRRLEAFAADEAKRVSGKIVPQIEDKAKQNI